MVFREAARRIKTNAKNAVTKENAGKVYRGARSAVSSVGHAAGKAVDAGERYGARVRRNTQTSPLLNGPQNRDNRSQNSGSRPQNTGNRSRGEHISYDRRGGEYISYGANSRREHVSFAGNHQRRESISFGGGGQSRGGHISFAGPSQGNPKRGGNRRRRRRR